MNIGWIAANEQGEFAKFARRRGTIDRSIAIDLTAMCDPDGDHNHPAILDSADNAIVADAIFPELAKFVACESFANCPGIVPLSDSVIQKS